MSDFFKEAPATEKSSTLANTIASNRTNGFLLLRCRLPYTAVVLLYRIKFFVSLVEGRRVASITGLG